MTDTVGQGRLGCASGLPAFTELEAIAGERPILIALRPARRITAWSLYDTASGTYVAQVDETWGHRRDVVVVRTQADRLTRAESIADCVATENSYFYDPEYVASETSFEWDSSTWDGGDYWDQVPRLFIHLTGGVSPDTLSVVAHFGFFYATAPCTHPVLGPDLFNGDGTMEA
jgi:hypothetical protein